jgi:hypothetical protein
MDALHFDNGQTLVQKITKYSEATTSLADEKAGLYYYPQEDERQFMEEKATWEYNTRLLDLLDSLHWAVERVDERLEDMVHTPVKLSLCILPQYLTNKQHSIWSWRMRPGRIPKRRF